VRRPLIPLFAVAATFLALAAGGALWMWRRLDALEAARQGPAADMSGAWWAVALGGAVIVGLIVLFIRLAVKGHRNG
jgi:hypothetical protein